MNQIYFYMMAKFNKLLSVLIITLLFAIASNPVSARLYYEPLSELKSQVSSGYSSSRFLFENPSAKTINVKIQIQHSNIKGH